MSSLKIKFVLYEITIIFVPQIQVSKTQEANMDEDIKVTVYTDEAPEGNPETEGYGTIPVSRTHNRKLSAGYVLTTGNRAKSPNLNKDICYVQNVANEENMIF
jgi:hypothetical protein